MRAFPDAERPERSFAQDGLAQAHQTPALAEQPRGEAGARLDIHALEQLATETGEVDGFTRRASHQHEHVDHRAGR